LGEQELLQAVAPVFIVSTVSSDRSHVGNGPRASFLPRLAFAALAVVFVACSGVDYDLRTASELYRDARYEAVQAWIAQLKREYPQMDATQRATFHYLSGMTAYRLAQREEARHELALAANGARVSSQALGSEQVALLYRTLEELTTRSPSSTSAR
jgi:hypothetical protein